MTVAQRIYLHHLPHTQRSFIMKQIDFEHGKITDNILRASIPMLVAEVLSLLYAWSCRAVFSDHYDYSCFQ